MGDGSNSEKEKIKSTMHIPENGFYMHYKHDPNGEPFNYMYEVFGLVRHTEDESFLVLYRPLYNNVWHKPANYPVRPVDMFLEEVEVEGKKTLRFSPITDPELIAKLEARKKEMYG